MLSTLLKTEIIIYVTFILSSANAFNFDKINFLSSGNGLKSQQRPTRKVFVYKIQVNPIHAIFKYGNHYDFMDR